MKNIIKTLQFVKGIVQLGNNKFDKNILEIKTTYSGVGGSPTPIKIIKPNKKSDQSFVIYPGASPYAEDHVESTKLGKLLASLGYQVFMPRIPPLKNLEISETSIDWMAHFWYWLTSQTNVQPDKIAAVGISFGGALLLKASLDERMLKNPPMSILTYGTYCNFETGLQFLTTGEVSINGKIKMIKPHEWGLVILFYNYIQFVELQYDTHSIRKVLKMRINDQHKQVEEKRQKFTGKDLELLNAILDNKITPEIQRIVKLFMEKMKPEFKRISPEFWCNQVKQKVFIIHGMDDSMIPFTESLMLANKLLNKRLLFTGLYEHSNISTRVNYYLIIKELPQIFKFFFSYFRYNERSLNL